MGGGRGFNRISYAVNRSGGQEAYEKDRLKRLDEYHPEVKPTVAMSYHMGLDKPQVGLIAHQAKVSGDLKVKYIKNPIKHDWKQKFTDMLKNSDALVVAVGEKTASRELVKWEIEKAYELDKPVIGMRLYSTENHRVPAAISRNDDPVVPWNMAALKEEVNGQITYGNAA